MPSATLATAILSQARKVRKWEGENVGKCERGKVRTWDESGKVRTWDESGKVRTWERETWKNVNVEE